LGWEVIDLKEIKVSRKTRETEIELLLKVNGSGETEIITPLSFFNHMLEAFARHARFDLKIKASGDIQVDPHHLIEDTGICLGKAVREYYAGRTGICRSGCFAFPMDDALALAAVDLSGRSYLVFDPDAPDATINNFRLKDLKEFFAGFTNEARANLHVLIFRGENPHHIYEAIFKAFGRALDEALSEHPRERNIPSTKGRIE
jgi:imidazoleglycerol-phosphate dehydratase